MRDGCQGGSRLDRTHEDQFIAEKLCNSTGELTESSNSINQKLTKQTGAKYIKGCIKRKDNKEYKDDRITKGITGKHQFYT